MAKPGQFHAKCNYVDYSVGENIYMLPSDMNLNMKTETVGYKKTIISYPIENLVWGKMIKLML